MGRRRQAAWGPRLEEGCGREPPRVPTVPAHPGQGAAVPPSWKSQEAVTPELVPRGSQCPQPKGQKEVAPTAEDTH